MAVALQVLSHNAEFDHFTLLFCRGPQCTSGCARAQPLFYSLSLLFSDVPVAIAFVVFLQTPLIKLQ